MDKLAEHIMQILQSIGLVYIVLSYCSLLSISCSYNIHMIQIHIFDTRSRMPSLAIHAEFLHSCFFLILGGHTIVESG